MNSRFQLKPLVLALLGTSLLGLAVPSVWAYDLGSVSSGAGNSNEAIPQAESASANAPTQGSLTATEPQSVISRSYIENTQSAASTYQDNVAIAPGVWSQSPNGPGGNDQGGLTMRSFTDGQYNVTFDGIPFADGADFTHHVNTYFLGQDTGEVTVDRGPGKASTVGDATYGGTIALRSNDPLSDPTATVRTQVGSFNSRLEGFQFDTGVMQNYGDASGFIDYNHYQTDGALTNNNERRGNVFAKFIKPLSEDTAITVVAMQNNTYQNASPGATAQQINQYGSHYGLNQNPLSTAYMGYNNDQFTSNFDYIGLQTRFGDWKIDNKVYTTSYAHNAMNGNNVNGASGQTLTGAGYALTTANGGLVPGANIPGQTGLTAYTSYGDIMRATRAFGSDDLNFGIWVDRQLHQSWTNNVDLSTGGIGSILVTPGTANGGNQAETSSMNTIQPYLEYVWRPTSKWAITPGLKWNDFNRTYNAAFDTTVSGPLAYSHSWSSFLPSLDLHYYLADNWSAYGQVAAGMQAPLLFGSFYYPANGAATTTPTGYLTPSKTMNYQIGSVFKSRKLTASADVYYITDSNVQNVGTTAAGLPTLTQVGAVHYQGIEGEATYNLGEGFNAYGNYSYNGYTSATPIFNAPSNTAALGMLYQHNRTNASLLAKEIGPRWGGPDITGNNTHFGSYTTANFAAGYLFGNLGWAKNAKVEFQLDDIFNRTDIISYAGATSGGNALFWTIPGRMVSFNLSAGF